MKLVVDPFRPAGGINQSLDDSKRGAIFKADQCAARTPGSLVQSDLPEGEMKFGAASGAFDRSGNIVEFAGHGMTVLPFREPRHCDDCDFITSDQDVVACPECRGSVG